MKLVSQLALINKNGNQLIHAEPNCKQSHLATIQLTRHAVKEKLS